MNEPSQSSPKIVRQIAWAVFAITFLVRLLVIEQLTQSLYFSPSGGDMKFYHSWALRILHGQFSDGYAFYGLPGYAWLMAGVYKLLGVNPFFLSILQSLSDAFIAFLIVKIATLIVPTVNNSSRGLCIGVLAGLGYAFYIPAQTFSVILMPTSFVVALLWFLVFWSMKAKEKLPSWLATATVGLSIGAMAMMVATIFFAIPLVVFGFWRGWTRQSLANWVGRTVLLLVCVVLGASPAIIYNRFVAKDPVMLSAHSGLNFFIGNNSIANGYPKIPDELRSSQEGMLQDSIIIAEKALGKREGQKIPRSAVSAYWAAKASAYIHEHPMEWLQLMGKKIFNFWNAYQYDDLSVINAFREEGITTPGLRFGILSALGLAGMLTSLLCLPRSRWVAAAVLLHLGSLLTVFVTERYRMAAVPGLLIFSAIFLLRLLEFLQNQSWRIAAGYVSTICVSAWFVTQPPPGEGLYGLDTFNAGVNYLAAGRLPQAEAKLKLAWQYKPENDETNFGLGNLYLAKSENQIAKYFYARTLRINPQHAGAYNNLGYIALAQEMWSAAIQFYGKSLAIEPDDAAANFQIARAYLNNHQLPEARAAVSRAIALRPNTAEFIEFQNQIPP